MVPLHQDPERVGIAPLGALDQLEVRHTVFRRPGHASGWDFHRAARGRPYSSGIQILQATLHPMLSDDQILARIREQVHHPATLAELAQRLEIAREDRPAFRRRLKHLVASGSVIATRGGHFGLPDRMHLVVGRIDMSAQGFGFVRPERPVEGVSGDIYVAGVNLQEAMQGDRVVVRLEGVTRVPERADRSGRPKRGPDPAADDADRRPRRPGARARLDAGRRPLRPRLLGPRLRRAVRQEDPGRHPGPADRDQGRAARRDGDGRDHALADADARPGRAHRRGARRHRRAGRRPPGHHPQVRDQRRARRRRRRRGDPPRIGGQAQGHRGPHRLPRRSHGDHRRRGRPRLRRRHHHRAPAERPLLARRAHRRRLALRAGGERARQGGLRARHLGLLPRARRAHVPARAVDGAVLAQPAGRSPRAVVPDGGQRQGRRRPLRAARRRHLQRRADDLQRRQRDPHREGSGDA